MPDENKEATVDEGGKEAAADAKGGDKGDEEGDLSTIINVDDFEEEGKEDKGKKKEGDEKGKLKPKVEMTPEVKELLDKNKALNRALHEERQKKKTEKTEEAVLTETQLLGILEEYKDDPKTLLNVIKYQAEQAAKGAATKSITDADVVRKKKEADDYIYKTYPDLTKDDSQLRAAVNKTKSELGIDDHPFGELFGTAVTFLSAAPQILKDAYDQGRKDAMAGVAEKTRKDLVKESDLTPKGKGGKITPLSANTEDVAKRLGLKSPQQLAILKKLTASGKNARNVSVED